MSDATWPADLPRPEVVGRLTDAMLAAVEEACKTEQASVAELTSAIFTLTHKAVRMLAELSRPEDLHRNKKQLMQAVDGLHDIVQLIPTT